MCRRIKKIIGFLIFTTLGLSSPLFSQEVVIQNQSRNKTFPPEKTTDKFAIAFHFLSKHYVDSLAPELLTGQVINHMLQLLDPHSLYISKKEYYDFDLAVESDKNQTGMEVNWINNNLLITAIEPGGTASKATLSPGDQILSLNKSTVQFPINKINYNQLNQPFNSPLDGKIVLQILQKGKERAVSITSKTVQKKSVQTSFMIDGTIGYIQLLEFNSGAHGEFLEALSSLQQQGLKKLILDLQDNGGGLLSEAVSIAEEFLQIGQLITYTEGYNSAKRNYFVEKKGQFISGSLILLINEKSASASEILAGAVQDWDRGLVIGRRSYGKGLIQRQFMLPDSSFMRLTTARYYTPSGRSIQKPYKVSEFSFPSPFVLKEEHYYTRIKQRHIFGGGGITPDLFVRQDTSKSKFIIADITYRSFVLEFMMNFKGIQKEFKSKKRFNKNYDKAVVYPQFIAFLISKKITNHKQSIDIKQDKTHMNRLKSYFAEVLFGKEMFFQLLNNENEILQIAKNIISDRTYLNYSLAEFE